MVDYNVTPEGKIVFVAGAASFIGSNLIKHLFQNVHDIKVIDINNMNNYYDFNFKCEHLQLINDFQRDFVSIEG